MEEVPHLLHADRAIFVGVHRFEDACVRCLKLLQGDGSVTVWGAFLEADTGPASMPIDSQRGPDVGQAFAANSPEAFCRFKIAAGNH
jgi:hypothetical protein